MPPRANLASTSASRLAVPASFRSLARAGRGASGDVHKAERNGAIVALKLVSDRALAFREAAWLGPLARRWGARLLEADVLEGGGAYLATEWVEGASLAELSLAKSIEERVQRAVVVAHGVGRALAELHDAGVRHGDVKPENVIWHGKPRRDRAEERGCTLVDLGLATSVGDAARGGTAKYAAPELRSDPDHAGREADLYALGVVLGEMIGDARAPKETGRAGVSFAEVSRWIDALLAPSPGGRPSASWIADRAARVLGLAADEEEIVAGRRAQIRRVYLHVREAELSRARVVSSALSGAPRGWLVEALSWRKHDEREDDRGELGPLGALGRARWLVDLVGPAAAEWPLPDADDARLAARLAELAAHAPAAAWTLEEIHGADQALVTRSEAVVDDEIDRAARLVAELVRPRPHARAIAMAEDDVARGASPPIVRRELARALLRAGDVGRAWATLVPASHAADDEDVALLAELARRRGDHERADAEARRAAESRDSEIASRARATLARLAWERGEQDEATRWLEGTVGALAAEVAALVASRGGDPDEAHARIERALASTRDLEARARLEGARGLLAHARGDAVTSARAFERAVDHAVQSGAVLEEATYLTGLAAAATDRGDVGRALASATRAALLWDRLGRGAQAARAWLSRASMLATLGAVHAADEAADEASLRALAAGDMRARAYARLARVEARAPGDARARAEALAAAEELSDGDEGDKVLASARLVLWAPAAIDDARILSMDARVSELSSTVRWEWWRARAGAWLEGRRVGRAEEILSALVALIALPAPLGTRGPALLAGRRLAEALGDGAVTRRLESARLAAAAELATATPASLRAGLVAVAWAERRRVERDGQELELAPGQIAQLESIVRALGARDGLKPLLEQVLDTLILWSGVERGVLLLRAPDGRLVPRAARNLARRDLTGEQLALSQSIAKRALELGDAVVATDAFSSLGDVQASVHALRLRSVLAVPLLARGEALGVVYLDDRVKRGAFGERELAWVRLVASQAAMALADARDQVLLRRSARRAERARAELSRLLGEREVELDLARAELRSQDASSTRYRYDAIAGRSEAMRALLRLVDRVTASDVPVLLVGESGTGKELLARAIHENGARQKCAFVSENCASVPESLLESVLFGHLKGAFTGAHATRPGLFDVADGGTFFLDEIGEMSLAMQAKLLRVLQDGEVRAVGGDRTRRVDVRVIGATHRDLEAMVRAGTFREDLFYRLNVLTLRVPPLRERAEDVPLLVSHFLEKHAAGRKIRVARAAMDRLSAFPWPGNVRQLENEVRRSLVLAEDKIDVADLSPEIARGAASATKGAGLDLRSRVDALEAELVREALDRTSGNQTRAAGLLGLSRFGLQKMMKRLGIRA